MSKTAILLTSESALLEIHGDTLLELAFYKLRNMFDKVLVVASDPEKQSKFSKILMDEVLCDYSMYSNQLTQFLRGLKSCRSETLFLASSNMPLLNQKAIDIILEQEGYGAVVPRYVNGRLEPTHATYSVKPTYRSVQWALNDELYSFEAVLKNISNVNYLPVGKIMEVDPQLSSFFQVKSVIDLDTATSRLNSKVFKGRLKKARRLRPAIRKDMETATAAYYKVPGTEEEHEVRFDKRKGNWTCDCKYYAMKGNHCSHILAAKGDDL